MVFRSSRTWCHICRDEKPDVTCTGKQCKKSFHWDCLGNIGQPRDEDDNADHYLCSRCREDEENDSFCYICKSTGNEYFTLLMCDGCPRSAHLECLKLDDIPTSETWMCTQCSPESHNLGTTVKSTLVNVTGGKPKLGNVDICYVCQKGGKLLCCDLCDQSYHPKCIDSDFLDPMVFDEAGKWGCPICCGKDPLKNMSHKRMTKRERQVKSDVWQKCIARESRRCRANRSKFLYSCRAALAPFVGTDVLMKLKKDAAYCSRSSMNRFSSLGDLKMDSGSESPKRSKTSTVQAHSGSQPSTDFRSASMLESGVLNSPETNDVSAKQSSVLYRDESLWKQVEDKALHSGYELLRQGVQLKPYQRWGVNWLLDAFYRKAGAILADEMGLGKTIQTVAFLSALKALEISGPHLIVVPLSTVGNWIREVRAFTPSLTVTKVCGSRQEREHSMMDGVAAVGIYDLFVTTYETVVTEEWFFTDRFQWQCVVLDEAHRIKNDSGRMRHSLDRVKCNMRVLLTGTPLQNNVKELFTLLNFLFPEVIKTSKLAETVFTLCKKKKKNSTSVPQGASGFITEDEAFMDPAVLDKEKVNALTLLLSKLMLRRTKDLVVKLPAKIEYDIWLPLTPCAGLWYRRLLELTATVTDDMTSLRKLLGAVIKIRICCCHPRGLVSRDTQLQNLIQTFCDTRWSDEDVAVIKGDAELLRRENAGMHHIRRSSKLLFLDKLLRQLHSENMELCEDYRKDFLMSRDNRLCQEINSRRTLTGILTSGRVIPHVTLEQVKKELDILTLPEESGGGLEGLQRHLYGETPPPTQQRHFLTKYMYPCTESSGGQTQSPRAHKVLIFTQFQLVLDELSSYCSARGWRYMRLDGSTNKMIRELDTREFNSPDSTHFVYLISTRAGGLGINLVTANHVVMFDEDWNPFVDLQAVDRAHRIGQTRQVHVWRLITEWTIEERMALRRQQKLRLDRMLIQANVEAFECQEEPSNQEKLSSEEVRRLLQYGRTALLEADFTNEIENSTLEEIMRRKRRDLKELEDEKLRLGDELVSSDGASEEICVTENLWNEVIAEPKCDEDIPENTTSPLTTPGSTSVVEDKDDDILDQEKKNEFTLYHRPQRQRRQPAVTYNPVMRPAKVHSERKVIRERRCFRCGGGGPPEGSKACEKSKSDPLVGCMRCPKVYHLKSCLGLTEVPPKSWMCPWHECCLCFRRAGSCGGLLIHCMECPTAFCFDCFPPEYRRFEPPPLFFEDLQKRGWNVTPRKLVTFLCSKCKALKEQERRRHLSKQQLDEEMKRRKSKDDSARQDAKKQQTRNQRALAKEQRQKQADARKLFFEQKRKLDDYDKQLQNDLRKAVDKLYPARYVEIVSLRRKRLIEQHHRNATTTTDSTTVNDGDQKVPPLPCTHDDAHSEEVLTTAPPDNEQEKRDHSMKLRPSNAHRLDAIQKKRLVIPDRFKCPGETLKLCDNCHFPLHDVTQCPFPLELCRFRIISNASNTEGAEAPVKTESLDALDSDGAKISRSKIKFRTVCSLCKSVTKLHARRHCSQLDSLQKEMYNEQREQYTKLLSLLQELGNKDTPSIQIPPRLKSVLENEDVDVYGITDKILDSVRRQLGSQFHTILCDALKEVGLEKCIVSHVNATDATVVSAPPAKIPNPKPVRKKTAGTPTKESRETTLTSIPAFAHGLLPKAKTVKKRLESQPNPESPKKRKIKEPFFVQVKCDTLAPSSAPENEATKPSDAPPLRPPTSHHVGSQEKHVAPSQPTVTRVNPPSVKSTQCASPSYSACSQNSLHNIYAMYNSQNMHPNVRTLSHSITASLNSSTPTSYPSQPTSQSDMMVAAALLNAHQSSDLSAALGIHRHGLMTPSCLPHPSTFWTPLPQPTRSIVPRINPVFSSSKSTTGNGSHKAAFINANTTIRPHHSQNFLEASNENVVEIELDSETA